MPVTHRRVWVHRTLYWFCLVIISHHFVVHRGVGSTRESQRYDTAPPEGPTTNSRKRTPTRNIPPGWQGTPKDLFYEMKPKFTSPKQWTAWKKRYGFAPLGEFCDTCRQLPGKCRYLQACQDYCAEDCYGHGKDFTIDILCDWCNGARDARCRDWRSCRKHCGLLCLHERYRLKVEADLRKEAENTKKLQAQLYGKYLQEREKEERRWADRKIILKKKQLEVTRKRLAKLAELEYHPLEDDL